MCPIQLLLHISGMKKTILMVTTLALVISCGGNNETTELMPEQLRIISECASMLARNLAFLPEEPGWSAAPGQELIAEIELMNRTHTEVWPVFFRAAADTATKLNQLEIQAQQEAAQAEML